MRETTEIYMKRLQNISETISFLFYFSKTFVKLGFVLCVKLLKICEMVFKYVWNLKLLWK
jgi:hypothetical protein